MREILFRGMQKNNGEWAYGFLLGRYEPLKKENVMKFAYIDNGTIFYNAVEVIPETIGQYTGLTDKNGKKIFEDDIVKVTDDNGKTEYSSCGIGYVLFYDGVWYIDNEVNDGLYDVNKIYYVEVIGNIHDNPELLE